MQLMNSTNLNTAANSDPVLIGSNWAVDANWTSSAFVAKTAAQDSDISTLNGEVTTAAHGWIVGTKLALTTSSGSLPAGFDATMYVQSVVSATKVKLALTYGGSAVIPTDTGSAGETLTLTPASTAIALKLQCSNDQVIWHDISGLTTSVASSGQVYWDSNVTSGMPKGMGFVRACYVMNDGCGALISASVRFVSKN